MGVPCYQRDFALHVVAFNADGMPISGKRGDCWEYKHCNTNGNACDKAIQSSTLSQPVPCNRSDAFCADMHPLMRFCYTSLFPVGHKVSTTTGRCEPVPQKLSCIDCPGSQYQSDKGQGGCIGCAVGQFHDATAQTSGASCIACGLGHYQPVVPPVFFEARCYEADLNLYKDVKGCTGYAAEGYTCVGNSASRAIGEGGYCATLDPTGDPAYCAKAMPAGSIVDTATGRCVIPSSHKINITLFAPPGTQISCKACDKGQFQAEKAQATCVNCGKGEYQSAIAQSSEASCIKCIQGTYQNKEGQPSRANCTKCAKGKFQNITGQENEQSCIDCTVGTYGDVKGRSACIKCSPGYYQPYSTKSSIDDCKECDIGRYQSQTGQGTCIDCKGEGTTLKPGRSFESECRPNDRGGAGNTGPNCTAGNAPAATVATAGERQNFKCVSCPPGAWAPAGAETCSLCPPGRANADPGGADVTACQQCDTSTEVCLGGTSVALSIADAKHLKEADTIQQVQPVAKISGGQIKEADGATTAGAIVAYVLLGLASFAIVCLHKLVPAKVWGTIDLFSADHVTRNGDPIVKRRTQLGSAFTFAFLPIVAILVIGLLVSNSAKETSSLQVASALEAKTGRLTAKLWLPQFSSESKCPDVTIALPVQGQTPGTSSSSGGAKDRSECSYTWVDCELGAVTVISFSIPFNQRWAKFAVAAQTAQLDEMREIGGQVVCADPGRILRGTTIVDIQAMPSFRNDTRQTASGDTMTGYV